MMPNTEELKNTISSLLEENGGELDGDTLWEILYDKYQLKHQDEKDKLRRKARKTILHRCEESKSFRGKEALFYAVDGLGKNNWGSVKCRDLGKDRDEDSLVLEGIRYHKEMEASYRSSKVRMMALIDNRDRHNGELRCDACGLNFSEVYVNSSEHVEIHHLRRISEGQRRTKLDDVVGVCPNCHWVLDNCLDIDRREDVVKIIKKRE